MAKTNQGGATAAGVTGIVQHGAPLADGRVLSELDPERNLDGTLIAGEHPDREDYEERSDVQGPVDPRPIDEPDEPDVSRETSEQTDRSVQPAKSASPAKRK